MKRKNTIIWIIVSNTTNALNRKSFVENCQFFFELFSISILFLSLCWSDFNHFLYFLRVLVFIFFKIKVFYFYFHQWSLSQTKSKNINPETIQKKVQKCISSSSLLLFLWFEKSTLDDFPTRIMLSEIDIVPLWGGSLKRGDYFEVFKFPKKEIGKKWTLLAIDLPWTSHLFLFFLKFKKSWIKMANTGW